MVVNFRTYEISRGARNLAQTTILIKKIVIIDIDFINPFGYALELAFFQKRTKQTFG